MKVLMIAPQPFFEPRGAPFCVYQHIQALTELGVNVDLITYPMGKQVYLPRLHIYRTLELPGIHEVKPGPSLKKIPLDIAVFLTAFWRLCWKKYRYIVAHEEGAFIGIVLSTIFKCKMLYYMHCNMAELISDNPVIYRFAEMIQKFMVRHADAVVAFYPELAKTAQQMAPHTPIYTILPPAVDEGLSPVSEEEVARLRQKLGLEGYQVLLYTGTLENYQGIDILLQSATIVRSEFPDVRYLIVGGKPHQVEHFRTIAQKLHIDDIVHFTGQRPLEEMPCYMALATILLSPRNKANHVPLKLYTYLHSGKPILATNILSHTQILNNEIAMLVPPDAENLARGTLMLLRHPQQALTMAERGLQFARVHYSWNAFVGHCQEVYHDFAPNFTPTALHDEFSNSGMEDREISSSSPLH